MTAPAPDAKLIEDMAQAICDPADCLMGEARLAAFKALAIAREHFAHIAAKHRRMARERGDVSSENTARAIETAIRGSNA